MRPFQCSYLLAGLLAAIATVSCPQPGRTAEPNLEDFVSKADPPSFATPSEAVAAFGDALKADDVVKTAALLGLDPEKLKASKEAVGTFALMREGASRRIGDDEEDGVHLVILGDRLWPLPFPIVKRDDGKWAFDTFAGLAEIVARRVGENEIETISNLRAYVDAQATYAEDDHDGDGVKEYAQRLVSSAGTRDGLFWSPDDVEVAQSPGGAALLQAVWDKVEAGDGYFGYHYRILTGQGSNVAGGQFDYIINGNMIAGYGLVAWPVEYGRSGIHTFVVSRDGIVYQADLGRDTAKMASDILHFNPGDKWEVSPE